MNINDWKPYLKLDPDGYPCMAQQTYEPLVSPDGKTFCKNYAFPNTYQYMEEKNRPLYTDEVAEWFFFNELTYLELFKDKPYAPEILDIDYKDRKILFLPKEAVHNLSDAFKTKVNCGSTNDNACNHQRDVKWFVGIGKSSM